MTICWDTSKVHSIIKCIRRLTLQDFIMDKNEDSSSTEFHQKIRALSPENSIFNTLLKKASLCAQALPKMHNSHDTTTTSSPLDTFDTSTPIQQKFCLLFLDLLEHLITTSTPEHVDFALLIIDKLFFERTSVFLQSKILEIFDRRTVHFGVEVINWDGLAHLLLFCFGLINQRDSEFQDNQRLFNVIARVYLACVLNGLVGEKKQVESVLLENLRRGARDIGGKKALIFKTQRIVNTIFRQLSLLKSVKAMENTPLKKRPASEESTITFELTEQLSEIIFIVSENQEIEKVDKLRLLSEQILVKAKTLWNPSQFESDQLQRRMQRAKKKSDLKRKLETMAITDPEKYAKVKRRLNEKKKRNRSARNRLIGLYKHASLAKKVKEF